MHSSKKTSEEHISQEQLQQQLAESLAEALYLNISEIDIDKTFIDLGMDSIVGVEWLSTINKQFKITIPASVVYDYPSIRKLATFLHQEIDANSDTVQDTNSEVTKETEDKINDATQTNTETALNQEFNKPVLSKPNNSISKDQLQQELSTSLAEALYLDFSDVDVNKTFVDLGMDSIVGVEWLNTINKQYKITIPASVVYDYPSINKLAAFLHDQVSDNDDEVQETITTTTPTKSLKTVTPNVTHTSQTSLPPLTQKTNNTFRPSTTSNDRTKKRNRFFKSRAIKFEPKYDNTLKELYYYSPHCSGNFENDGEVSVNYIIGVENNICLKNHQVFGEYLLPTDAYIEMLYTACRTYFSINQISLKNISIINPILGFSDRNVYLKIIFQKHDDGLKFTFKSSFSSKFENEKIHMQGFVFKKTTYDEKPARLSPNKDLSSLRKVENDNLRSLQKDVNVGDFYATLKELSFGNNFALGKIQTSNHGLRFLVDPTVLFAGLTSTMFFATHELSKQYNVDGDVFIPSSIEGLTINGSIDKSNYFCYAEVLELEKDKVKLYFEIVDQSYQPILVAESITIQRVSHKVIQQMVGTTKNYPADNSPYTISENKTTSKTNQLNTKEDIAIIGMSCRYPLSETVEDFWQNLKQGKSCITEVPDNRWKEYQDWYHPDPMHRGTTNNKWGGFIDDVDLFDPLFFGISPSEAEFMDPQQRIFLQECWKTIENAGYASETLSEQSCGVYVGCAAGDYGKVLANQGKDTDGSSFLGTSNSILAARISYHLNLKGPAIAIDTACSSSLTAIHLACESIRNQENKLALAGGIALMVTPGGHILTSQVGMQSKTGRCAAFDQSADGTVFSEGCGVVMLKSMSEAIKDNDHILGVIKASGLNQDGKTNGITAPSTLSQTKLLSNTYQKYNINPEKISYVEAHGTGTTLGDPIEVSALTSAFRKFSKNKNYCAIGSVKSNIGHSSFSAGVSGLIKILLCLQYKKLVPSVHFENPNPHINFENSPFFVNTNYKDWESDGPRLACINSFGFSGTNAHLVIEEHVPKHNETLPSNIVNSDSHIIVLSAKTEEQLLQKAKDLSHFIIREYEQLDEEKTVATEKNYLTKLAYTLQVGRDSMEFRLGFIVTTIEQLTEKLETYVNRVKKTSRIYHGQVKRNAPDLETLINDDEIKEMVISKIIANKNSAKLLDLWIKGLDIDWNNLYGNKKPERISLPNYPFAKESYWVEPTKDEKSSAIAVTIHPLVQHNTSDINQQRYSTIFSGEEFFFTDHKVQGQKILPGVAYLEMARAAVEDAVLFQPDSTCIELYNTVWLQPIIGTKDKQVSIELTLDENEQINFEIYSINEEKTLIHSQGSAVLSPRPQDQVLDIQQLRAEMKNTLDVTSFYDTYTAMGIEYGSAHKAITALYKGNDSLLAYLTLPSSVETGRNNYFLHPSIMDCALQSALGLIADLDDQSSTNPSLPFALEYLRVLSPCTRNMVAWVRYAENNNNSSNIIKLDVDLCDADGKICVEMYGFSARQVGEASQMPTLFNQQENPVGLQSLVPVWNAISHTKQEKIVLSESTKILVIASQKAHADWVKKTYANTQYLNIPLGATQEIIQKKLASYSFDQLIWMAPDVAKSTTISKSDLSEQIITKQNQGVIELFRIIKTLLQLEYADKELQWTIITGNTQLVTKGSKVNATHSGVFGLVGSLAKEFPQWKLRLLDIESIKTVSAEECLSLPWNKQGDALVYRQEEWFKEGLSSMKLTSQNTAVYKQKGVYVVIGGAGGLGEVWSRFMIENYDAKIIWIGRRELNSEIENKINELSQLKNSPLYITADATNLESLKKAFETIKEKYSVINGVVHSAIVLQDQSLINMNESKFKSSLSAKVDISVNMNLVFGNQDLDFMLFFSSIISISKSPGQSNYAAGCTFKDAFAHELNEQYAYPVKTINWGYWGNIGIVASESYNTMMEQMGIGSIEPEEGMKALQTLVNSDFDQMVLLKTLSPKVLDNFNISDSITKYEKVSENILPQVEKTLAKQKYDKQLNDFEKDLSNPELEKLQKEILISSLVSIGFFKNGILKIEDLSLAKKTASFYEQWLARSISYLYEEKLLTNNFKTTKVKELKDLWTDWENNKTNWATNPNLKAQIDLVEACLKALPAIITGKKLATDVMFPNSSMKLVEGIYKDNSLADFYNDVLGKTLITCIEQLLKEDKTRNIRILEIGAGTGGTTANLLPLLKDYSNVISEYCYTDLSKAFLMYAEENFAPEFPALTTELFDVTKPLASQTIAIDSYDLVIAANVLHATPNIRETLRNTKAVLKTNGILLLNEISVWSLFTHLTFGLLEGWWLHKDTTLRIEGNPGITPNKWQELLIEEGYNSVFFPSGEAYKFGQQIIAANSNGFVRQSILKQKNSSKEERKILKHAVPTKAIPTKIKTVITDESDATLREKSIQYFQRLIAETLKINQHRLDSTKSLTDYGLDSILVNQLTAELRKDFPNITSTLFFEVQSIEGLADYFIENDKDELMTVLSINKSNSVQNQAVSNEIVEVIPEQILVQTEENLRDKSILYLQKLVAKTLKIDQHRLDSTKSLTDYGLDSILVNQLTAELRKDFPSITSTLFFEVQSIEGLADYLLENNQDELITILPNSLAKQTIQQQSIKTIVAKPELSNGRAKLGRRRQLSFNKKDDNSSTLSMFDVAIIGISGRYPKSNTINEFWENLSKGVNCITEIPKERWNWEEYYDPKKGKEGKMYTKWGGFLKDIDKFDPMFFKISPAEAEGIDPQERLFLESCYHAIEDAGYTPENLDKSRKIGVYAGVMNSRYSPTPTYFSISNRVSYLLNFQGPSMTVDTACSSSLSAIHLALESLYSGLSSCAIAGGVNLIIDPVHYLRLTGMNMLSTDDSCKAFGANADGFIDAEGVGAVILKPLKQAEQDGDHIYGVIKGSAVNAGGKTNGYTVPNPNAQATLIAEALKRSNVTADKISYIEAHGTGTALGDPIEISALTKAFKQSTQQKQFCAIGSSKSNIGHCESAAGMAALTKVLLQFKNEQIVPSLNASEINPEIDFSKTPFKLQQNLERWERPIQKVNGITREIPRTAGISSFGAGGANVHLVVQEYQPSKEVQQNIVQHTEFIIPLSAKSKEQINQKVNDLLTFIKEAEEVDLTSMSFTLQTGREAMNERLGFIVNSVEELTEKFQAFLNGDERIDNVYQGNIKNNTETLALFRGDTDLKEAIEKWFVNKKLPKLLDLWTKGLDMDWNKLYSGNNPKRISLPFYPFARHRIWKNLQDPNATVFSGATNGSVQNLLHPLIHTNTSTLIEQQFSSTFTGEEFFLKDHQVQGDKVLPGVAYLEMAHEAVKQALGEQNINGESYKNKIIQLKNVVWVRPIVVNGHPSNVKIRLLPDESGEINYEVYTIPSASNTSSIIHSQGVATQIEVDKKPFLNLLELQEQLNIKHINPEEFYNGFSEMGIQYGPAHKGLEEVLFGNNTQGMPEVLAKIKIPSSVIKTKDQFMLHPSLLDSALQASIGINFGEGEVGDNMAPMLPFALEQLDVINRPEEEMWAWIRHTKDFEASTKIQKLDIDLCNNEGEICVRMKGFSSRILTGDVKTINQEKKQDEIGTLMLNPVWKEKSIPTNVSQHQVPFEEHRVMLIGLNQSDKILKESSSQLIFEELKLSQNSVDNQFTSIAIQMFEQLRKIIEAKPTGKVLIQLVIPNQDEKQIFSGLSGMLKTAHLENSKIVGQVIAVRNDIAASDLITLLKENSNLLEDQEIRYVQDSSSTEKRLVNSFEAINTFTDNQELPWKEGGVYLITGGVGGLGILFAQEIAKKTKDVTVILIGRSSLNDEKKSKISSLENLGLKCIYKRVDVADNKEVHKLVKKIIKDFGKLNGIIHSAGVIRDNIISKKTTKEFESVLAPKVAGTINLDEATKKTNLDFLALFSSGAGVMGNAGQADYATANAFIDVFSRSRNTSEITRRLGRTISINWPLWKEGGMSVDEEIEKMLEKSVGMMAMETNTGIQAFYQALSSKSSQVLVIAGWIQRIKQNYLAKDSTKTSHSTENDRLQKNSSTNKNSNLQHKIQQLITELVSEALKIKVEDLDADVQLSEFGFDSISLTAFANTLNEKYKMELNPTIFFEYPTIEQFTNYLNDSHYSVFAKMFDVGETAESKTPVFEEFTNSVNVQNEAQKPKFRFAKVGAKKERNKDINEPIAIVGVSGRFPGSKDIPEFWNNLLEGKDCIDEIPKSRWDWKSIYGNPNTENYKTNIKWGGFIDGIDEFDPQFFGISRKEAQYLDPQHRLLMSHVWTAIEDAGHSPLSLSGSKTGIFIGTGMSGYSELFTNSNASVDDFTPTGIVSSMGPNRLSYLLNIHGPSEPIETACSSTLIAINRAINAMEIGSCDQAIVGGMNTIITPNGHIAFNKVGLLCEDGRCKTFSKDANGYVRGEGIGILFLKKLKNAEADNNHIYALIKGGAENHGGRASSLTSPSPKAQSDVIVSAYKRAGVDPRTVSYIEAHGTGTLLGDSVEMNGLNSAFDIMSKELGKSPVKAANCGLGSVKTNIGHLEFASGAAGIIKVLLQLKNKKLVKSLNSGELSPYINLKNSPFYIVNKAKDWETPLDIDGNSVPRRAGVSAFGFGGVNAHIILEEYIPKKEIQDDDDVTIDSNKPVVITLSAKNAKRLDEYVKNMLEFINKNPEISLVDLAYTLQVGRDAMGERLGFVVKSINELVEKLQGIIEVKADLTNVFVGNVKQNKQTIITFNAEDNKQQILNQWLANEEFDKILDLWTKGLSFEWSNLYGKRKPKRISLPTYPFAKEKYWFDSIHNIKNTEIENATIQKKSSSFSDDTSKPLMNGSVDKMELFLKQEIALQLHISTDNIDSEDNFFDLGVDSLGITNLIGKTNELLQESIMPSVIFEHTSISKLVSFLTESFPYKVQSSFTDTNQKVNHNKLKSTENKSDSVWTKTMSQVSETSNIIVPLQTKGKNTPIFALPGVGGSVICFQPLSQALGNNQPLYGLQSIGLDGKTTPFDNVKKIAKTNILAIKEIQPKGPYHLLGYSNGGVIAFEMAKILLRQKEKIASLSLIDSLCPSLQTEDEVEQIVFLYKNLAQTTGIDIADLDIEKLRQVEGNERMDYLYDYTKNYGFEMTKEQFTTMYSVAMTNAKACRDYKPTKIPNNINVYLFRAKEAYPSMPKDYGWNQWLRKPLKAHEINSDHFSIIDKDPIGKIANKILKK